MACAVLQACAAEVAAWLAQGGAPQPLPRVVARLATEPSLAVQGPAPLLARCALAVALFSPAHSLTCSLRKYGQMPLRQQLYSF